MADVVVNLEIDNPEELVNQGIKAFNLADFNTAVTALSRAVELLAAKHGDKHDSLGNAYFYYGKTLLELYREEIQPLGDVVPRELDSDSDEDVDTPTENVEESSKIETNGASNDKIVENKSSEVSQNASISGDNNVENQKTNGEVTIECASTSEVNKDASKDEEPAEEEPSDLQVAWEVLELAKIIFSERGEVGKKELAETHVLLGEVSLESENFTSAIDDIKQGIEIQKTIVESNSRTLAESYYKLAVALSTNNQIDEAVEHFNISLDILKSKINTLKENEEPNNEEIKEIQALIPEIEEKIADMKSFKEETANRLMAAIQAKPESKGPFDAATSATSANDISHLIKRKRKADEEDCDSKPAKKVSE